jgi:hypothetical protein
MAAKKTPSSRGRKQDRARIAGGQDYEVGYEARKTKSSRAAVRKAVKTGGNSRKQVERVSDESDSPVPVWIVAGL